ncbi:hypothetical protein Naga_101185g1, partial [Nannochloropsis gaditana]
PYPAGKSSNQSATMWWSLPSLLITTLGFRRNGDTRKGREEEGGRGKTKGRRKRRKITFSLSDAARESGAGAFPPHHTTSFVDRDHIEITGVVGLFDDSGPTQVEVLPRSHSLPSSLPPSLPPSRPPSFPQPSSAPASSSDKESSSRITPPLTSHPQLHRPSSSSSSSSSSFSFVERLREWKKWGGGLAGSN